MQFNQQQRQMNAMQAQQNAEKAHKDKSLNNYLEEQNPQLQNESYQMRKAIRTYFDSQPFSTIQGGDKSKGQHSSCSNSYSGDNSDIITTYSQTNPQFHHESDTDFDENCFLQQQMKKVVCNEANAKSSQLFVPKNQYDLLQKSYYELQQKYFNVREEIKENQSQLSTLLSELRSHTNQQNSSYSQFSDQSMSCKLEEKFTTQINRAFRIMYENLKEESEKTIELKDEQIQQLQQKVEEVQKTNELLIMQNEQKENALIDIVQYYGILKQQIDSINHNKESVQHNQQGSFSSLKITQNLNSNFLARTNMLQNVNTNQSIQQQQQQPLQQIENLYSIHSHTSSTAGKNILESGAKQNELQFQSNGLTKQNAPHLNSGFSFANNCSPYKQESERKQKDFIQSNKENSCSSFQKQDFSSNKLKEKKQFLQEYETFQTEDCDKSSNQAQQLHKYFQVNHQKSNNSLSQQQQESQVTQLHKSQIDENDNISETVFEDMQGQSAFEWQFTSNQQGNLQNSSNVRAHPQFGEENYVSNDISASLQYINQGQQNYGQTNQISTTPNKQFRQLNDYLHTHETNFEQEQEEIQLIHQKVKKSNRLNMLAKLKKEIFQEGLKSALIPSQIQTNRKGGTTPRKLVSSRNSKVAEQIPQSSRSRMSEVDSKPVNLNLIEDPVERGFLIIEDLYHSIDRRFKNQN